VSVAREQAEQRLAAALAAGGRIVDDSNAQSPGSSPTAPATVSASPPGRMALPARSGAPHAFREGPIRYSRLDLQHGPIPLLGGATGRAEKWLVSDPKDR
jgi:hypothetical protein